MRTSKITSILAQREKASQKDTRKKLSSQGVVWNLEFLVDASSFFVYSALSKNFALCAKPARKSIAPMCPKGYGGSKI